MTLIVETSKMHSSKNAMENGIASVKNNAPASPRIG
ncbi:YegP family protein [Algibacter sp. 2305UL17-15]